MDQTYEAQDLIAGLIGMIEEKRLKVRVFTKGRLHAKAYIRDFGGAFVSDVVGLGKSYIGAAIVKHFERTDHARPLIICPAPLTTSWISLKFWVASIPSRKTSDFPR